MAVRGPSANGRRAACGYLDSPQLRLLDCDGQKGQIAPVVCFAFCPVGLARLFAGTNVVGDDLKRRVANGEVQRSMRFTSVRTLLAWMGSELPSQ
jgi:hypothetical protein